MLQARRLLRIMVGVPQSLWLCADAVEVADHRRMVHQTKDLHIVNGREPRISKVSSKIILSREGHLLLSYSQTDHGSESAGGRHHGHAYDIIILNYYYFLESSLLAKYLLLPYLAR